MTAQPSTQPSTQPASNGAGFDRTSFEFGRRYEQTQQMQDEIRVDERAEKGLLEDPLGWEEDDSYTVRQQLGLRSIFFPDNTDGTKGLHPDQRGCPSWCWIAQQDDFDHSVDTDRPTVATHTMDQAEPAIRASMYRGSHVGSGDNRGTTVATVEPHLEQIGQSRPFIRIGLRSDRSWHPDRLKLTIDDARELVVVLSHLIGVVDADNARDGH